MSLLLLILVFHSMLLCIGYKILDASWNIIIRVRRTVRVQLYSMNLKHHSQSYRTRTYNYNTSFFLGHARMVNVTRNMLLIVQVRWMINMLFRPFRRSYCYDFLGMIYDYLQNEPPHCLFVICFSVPQVFFAYFLSVFCWTYLLYCYTLDFLNYVVLNFVIYYMSMLFQ